MRVEEADTFHYLVHRLVVWKGTVCVTSARALGSQAEKPLGESGPGRVGVRVQRPA